MSLLYIKNLFHSYSDTVLFKDADMTLNKGEHIGIVGQNGAGKSTFIKICTGLTVPDEGRVVWDKKIKVGYLDQYAKIDDEITIEDFLKSSFMELYTMEEKMNELYIKSAEGDLTALDKAGKYQERLEMEGFYEIDTKIKQISTGLGLDAIGLDRKVVHLSGGQRAKVILSKLLLQKPDVLLLDEPTNFLDKEHVAWLSEYLKNSDNAFMVVSHDHTFLENISNRICDIDNCKINKYYGTYSEFLKKKEMHREDYIRKYNAQQREIKKTEEFIRRNIAGRKTRMAKGRRKQLERMDKMEALDTREIKPVFDLKSLVLNNTEQLIVNRLKVGYDYPVLRDISLSIKGGEKVVITGFNGIGKSTLLKTLTGNMEKLGGSFEFSPQVIIGYYEQDLIWEDGKMTPIEIVSGSFTKLSGKELRRHLSRCGVNFKHSNQEISSLSGGEQAKVKMCLLTLRPCNFLIMDEPTNHLDKNAKEALKKALRLFRGSVILVSHEEEFYKDFCDRVIHL